jgi:hypothetical protein
MMLLQDGTELQRLMAFRHGEQRARLGWSEDELRREFAALGQVMDQALRHRGVPPAAWSVVARFLGRAEDVATGSLCSARREPSGGAGAGAPGAESRARP